MRPILIAPAAIAASAALAACATTPEERSAYEASEAAKVPAATPTGEAVSCIQTNRIRETRVHGDSVIDFVMDGGRVYRNRLPNRCSGLGFEERFGYETHIGQLCSTDTITVLCSPPQPGPTCGLGEFQPVELAGD
ncbi:DUF6491 family protein [Stakelama saccharophila]|uniref:DUF6491 family protein n=1 Tax=Stakelama saccharophila TaxID=3075605 RepID=A0ABZ0B839_9SPHN|nr:DUF6491 family protein [Stakelama sp. W311]WNO53600.1 DUF6491 family protein [Stakelama sp. W311]